MRLIRPSQHNRYDSAFKGTSLLDSYSTFNYYYYNTITFPNSKNAGQKTFFIQSWLLSTPYFYSLHCVTYYLKDRTLLLVISSTSKLQYGVHVHVEAASRVCLSCLLDQDRYSQHVEDPLLTAKVSFSFPFPSHSSSTRGNFQPIHNRFSLFPCHFTLRGYHGVQKSNVQASRNSRGIWRTSTQSHPGTRLQSSNLLG